ncbi:PREDICTED: beta-defensin 1 [Chinchilla lanigera]|uniref:beta-defensin 1 n=1 Tax=Chinchilla lanigera TaxID=34839 RepID=UPI00038EC4BC|nr:PREDICTED: beta-defensin 1 [Chinchilla lanigera]
MRTHCLLLLMFCLLFCPNVPGAGLTGLGHRADHYQCVRNGGFCLYSACPMFSKIVGTCYNGKAKCCT